ncbi:MAG: hypothetical protein EXR99_08310 [Gemmataceae bacterium]|nr:hypothetical protein [Gemmataceae bacterium]
MSKALTKSAVLGALAEKCELSKKQVATVLDEVRNLVVAQLGKKGPGIFTIPGILKLKRKVRPATKEREGINPFTKEKQIFKAKPASIAVRANALKAFKEAIK